jgi:hypothetical protein
MPAAFPGPTQTLKVRHSESHYYTFFFKVSNVLFCHYGNIHNGIAHLDATMFELSLILSRKSVDSVTLLERLPRSIPKFAKP